MSLRGDTSSIPRRKKGGFFRTLAGILDHARSDDVIRKTDLGWGDRVIVRTRNSVYSLWALGGDTFAVSGGWFDKQATQPSTVNVNGCTYGGSVIRHDVVAGTGLFLEFGNSVSTTRIQDVRVERFGGAAEAPLPC